MSLTVMESAPVIGVILIRRHDEGESTLFEIPVEIAQDEVGIPSHSNYVGACTELNCSSRTESLSVLRDFLLYTLTEFPRNPITFG